MLAQNFKSAAELKITEAQKEALMKTLVLLETGKLKHVPYSNDMLRLNGSSVEGKAFDGFFNMACSFAAADCGTIACIRGTAMMVSGVDFPPCKEPAQLHDLFYHWAGDDPDDVQAATALRSYLTIGDAKWHEAVA
jgi:hypothetical protein